MKPFLKAVRNKMSVEEGLDENLEENLEVDDAVIGEEGEIIMGNTDPIQSIASLILPKNEKGTPTKEVDVIELSKYVSDSMV